MHHTSRGQKIARAREEWHEDLHDAPRRQKPPLPQPNLFDLSLDVEPGGARPDRLSEVRPQEQVQRRTVVQIVDSPLGLPLLDALVPLVVEKLVDVFAFVEEQKKQEDARMNRLEDLDPRRVACQRADWEAWRRWVTGAKRK